MIGIHDGLRTPSNKIVFGIYKAIRRFHVAIWFYPFPFLVMIFVFNVPFMTSFYQEHDPEFFVPITL